MEMIKFLSSVIRAVSYGALVRLMRTAFFEEDAYDFCGVLENVFKGLLHSESKERYYNGRRQKLSATPDLSGTVLPLCLIPNS
ncbi:KTSC domain-containing protein, partial [Metapseudomonas otitidis]